MGWIGSIFLALCGVPQAYQCYNQKHAKGINTVFLVLWTAGEIFTLIAVAQEAPLSYLLFNYTANLVCLGIIWRYK
jgi:uncharacterized protein with PQ loop repeat